MQFNAADRIFCVCFYKVYDLTPNVGGVDTDTAFDNYMKSIVVCAALVRKAFGTEVRFRAYMNVPMPEPYLTELTNLGGKVFCLVGPFRYVDDATRQVFPGCLFTLDVVNYLAATPEPGVQYHFVDTDWLCQRPFESDGIEALELNYSRQHLVNGWRVSELAFQAGIEPSVFHYYGGEYYSFPAEQLTDLSEGIFHVWMKTEPRPVTEEHVFSILLNQGAYQVNTANNKIARIWTVPSLYQFGSHCERYAALHMPAEKNLLIPKLYRALQVGGVPSVWQFFDEHVRRHSPLVRLLGLCKRMYLNLRAALA